MTSDGSPKACCGPIRAASQTAPGKALKTAAPVPIVAGAGAWQQQVVEIASIPGGRGLLGTDAPVLSADGEAPLRRKGIKPFRMDSCAVTNARFAAFAEDTGYLTEAERFGESFVFYAHLPAAQPPTPTLPEAPWWHMVPGASWRCPEGPYGVDAPHPDHPVTHVTWHDALAFAKWAGGRLPTEAEWEHAARGGLGDVPYPWGLEAPNETDQFPCNIWQGRFPERNTGADGYKGTAPACSYAPNGYGLYNMVGNVWEWTSQPFRVRSLKRSVKAAHQGRESYKLTKGGSFLCHASYCFRYRIAARTGNSPDSSTGHTGFRLVYAA